jgi:hypothetical protein
MVSLVGHIGLYNRAGHISGFAWLEIITEPNTDGLNPALKFSSIADQQRDLLRQVGTSEANRFAEQADQAEAKRFGFDQTFGSSIDTERKGLEATRATLEAELKTSYEVAVTMQFDTAGIVGQVTDQVGVLIAKNNESLKEQIDRKLQDRLGDIQQKASLDLRAKKQGQKG